MESTARQHPRVGTAAGGALAGEPLQLEAHIATESILQQTLLLFASTIVAAGRASGGDLVGRPPRTGRGDEGTP